MSARPRRSGASSMAAAAATAAIAEAAAPDIKTRIEQVATRLFIRHGYNGVSYIDIGRELGTTHSGIHYHFRTKDVLAEAVLRRVAADTLATMSGIWTDPRTTLFDKLVGTRDSIHRQYLAFNPDGKGGRPWGLLARFTIDAEFLTPAIRKLIRSTLEKLDEAIATGVRLAIESGELVADAPEDGLTLQISSLMTSTGQLTRRASGFERLHELMRWTYLGIVRAYGRTPATPRRWPDLPRKPRTTPAKTTEETS